MAKVLRELTLLGLSPCSLSSSPVTHVMYIVGLLGLCLCDSNGTSPGYSVLMIAPGTI